MCRGQVPPYPDTHHMAPRTLDTDKRPCSINVHHSLCFQMEEKCPLNLLHLCRLCIRRHLTNIRGDAMLDEKLFQLQGVLPEALIKSLWMIDDFVELKSLT